MLDLCIIINNTICIFMRTTLDIPLDLLQQVLRLAGVKTKTEAIVTALKEYIRQKKIEQITQSAGKIEFAKNFNWEKLRHGR